MSVLVVGMSHRSAPVGVLEQAAVGADDVPKLLDEMMRAAHVNEVVLLSTCNRIEVIAVVDAFHGGLADVGDVLARHAGLPLVELTEHLYVHYAGSAVQHLFAVAAGSTRWSSARRRSSASCARRTPRPQELGTVGRVLHELSQHALRVGKVVHSPHRHRLRRRLRGVGGADRRRGAARRRARRPARGAGRCRRHGRARRSAPAPRGRRRDRGAQPRRRARRDGWPPPPRARHRGPRRPASTSSRPSWPPPTCSWPAPAPSARVVSRVGESKRPSSPTPAARSSSATSGCPATSTRAWPSCPGSPSSTWPRCRSGSPAASAGRPSRRRRTSSRRRRRPTSPRSAPPRSRPPSRRCASARPR